MRATILICPIISRFGDHMCTLRSHDLVNARLYGGQQGQCADGTAIRASGRVPSNPFGSRSSRSAT
jgi:hypothetical protein